MSKWFWSSNTTQYNPYSVAVGNQIEEHFNTNPESELFLTIKSFQYKIDFIKFRQINLTTKKSRSIRRVEWIIEDEDVEDEETINLLNKGYETGYDICLTFNGKVATFSPQDMEIVVKPDSDADSDEYQYYYVDRIEDCCGKTNDIVLRMTEEKLRSPTSILPKDPSKNEIIDFVKNITGFRYCSKDEKSTMENNCPICLCDLNSEEEVVEICGKDVFHLDCLCSCADIHNEYLKCPLCLKTYGVRRGTMPVGTMRISTVPNLHCAGYKCGTITIHYEFPSGYQGKEHPHPGEYYDGTARTAYLPDNKEGRYVLELFKIAWERRLLFTIGQSVTTGLDNCVIWNGIHHKTNTHGGFASFGYPDDSYFLRVITELRDKGVTLPDPIEFDESTRTEFQPVESDYEESIEYEEDGEF